MEDFFLRGLIELGKNLGEERFGFAEILCAHERMKFLQGFLEFPFDYEVTRVALLIGAYSFSGCSSSRHI